MYNFDHIKKHAKQLRGFSLGELLVVIVIVTLLAITIIMAYQNQVAKANDVKRKENLSKYKIAFEDYLNDNPCYLTEDQWNNDYTCDTADFAPYMEKFLCDPTTRKPYLYRSCEDEDGSPDPYSGYKLYAKLENKGDPDIVTAGCSWGMGCGIGILASYNYGIAVGCQLTAVDFNPNATPTPTPTSAPAPGCESASGPWACNTAGVCNGAYSAESFTLGKCSVGFKSAACCQASGCPDEIWCKQ